MATSCKHGNETYCALQAGEPEKETATQARVKKVSDQALLWNQKTHFLHVREGEHGFQAKPPLPSSSGLVFLCSSNLGRQRGRPGVDTVSVPPSPCMCSERKESCQSWSVLLISEQATNRDLHASKEQCHLIKAGLGWWAMRPTKLHPSRASNMRTQGRLYRRMKLTCERIICVEPRLQSTNSLRRFTVYVWPCTVSSVREGRGGRGTRQAIPHAPSSLGAW